MAQNKLKRDATGDELRARLPLESWLPYSFHLIALDDGVLSLAPLYEAGESELRGLGQVMADKGYLMSNVDVKLWDRHRLYMALQHAHEVLFDRANKALLNWMENVSDKRYIEQFFNALISEAIQEGCCEVKCRIDGKEDGENAIVFRDGGTQNPVFLLPHSIMKMLLAYLAKRFSADMVTQSTTVQGRCLYEWFDQSVELNLLRQKINDEEEEITISWILDF